MLLILPWLLGCLGCATAKSKTASPASSNVTAKAKNPSVSASSPAPYKLQFEDEIEVKFHFVPELNDRLRIRPDGMISLQLIDEVKAAGLTPAELDRVLTEKYSSVLHEPELTVIVREFSGRQVFVGGEVRVPGMIPLKGNLTAFQAILQAGGFKNSSKLTSVVLLRNQGSKKPFFATLNLEEHLAYPESHNDVYLQPYDVVFVPKTMVASLGQFVDQYINQLIPRSFHWGFTYLHNLNTPFVNPPPP